MRNNIFKIYEQTTSDDILKNLANFFWKVFIICVLCGIAIVTICFPFWLMLIAQNSFGAEAFVRAIVFILTAIIEIGSLWVMFCFYMGLDISTETNYVGSGRRLCKYTRNGRETRIEDNSIFENGAMSKTATKNFENIQLPTKQELILFRTSYPDQVDSNFDYVFKYILK